MANSVFEEIVGERIKLRDINRKLVRLIEMDENF